MNNISVESSRRNFMPVFVAGLIVIVVSFIVIAAGTSNNASREPYTSYVISEDVTVYDLARSITPDDMNVWEVVYRIKEVNNITGDTLSAYSSLQIPASLIDTSTGDPSVYLCSAE